MSTWYAQSNWTDVTPYLQQQLLDTSITATITAHSGGGATSAVALTSLINVLTTVAAAGNSVKLPQAIAPSYPTAGTPRVVVTNLGAFPAQVFPVTGDTINGNASVCIGVGATAVFVCTGTTTWVVAVPSLTGPTPVALTGSGAIYPHCGQLYVVTDAAAAGLTLAAPTATVDDGIVITVTSNTAYAHTITATGLLQTGAAGTGLLTAAAYAGTTAVLMAYQAKWNVLSLNGYTVTS